MTGLEVERARYPVSNAVVWGECGRRRSWRGGQDPDRLAWTLLAVDFDPTGLGARE